MRVAIGSGMFIERPHQAKKNRAVARVRFQGQEAHFQRPGSGALQNLGIGKPVGHRKRRLIVAAYHADDATFSNNDKVSALIVELVNEAPGAGIGMLGNFVDEGSEVELMDLLKFLASFRAFENVGADMQHPGHLQRCLVQKMLGSRRDAGPSKTTLSPAKARSWTHDPCGEEVTNAAVDLQAFCARKRPEYPTGPLNLEAFAPCTLAQTAFPTCFSLHLDKSFGQNLRTPTALLVAVAPLQG